MTYLVQRGRRHKTELLRARAAAADPHRWPRALPPPEASPSRPPPLATRHGRHTELLLRGHGELPYHDRRSQVPRHGRCLELLLRGASDTYGARRPRGIAAGPRSSFRTREARRCPTARVATAPAGLAVGLKQPASPSPTPPFLQACMVYRAAAAAEMQLDGSLQVRGVDGSSATDVHSSSSAVARPSPTMARSRHSLLLLRGNAGVISQKELKEPWLKG
ncbi:unnamed protein product [Urochloa humidicola]